MFEITFTRPDHYPIVFGDEEVTQLNLQYADEPARQAAMLAYVNGTAEYWVDSFGRWPATWRRVQPDDNR